MHRIVPELIVENYKSGKYQGSFRAVGMFLDLSGFSNLTDALMKQGQYGAEVLVGLMHNVFDPVVKSIFEHGGKIVGFAGDGIMALFPVQADDRSAALHALASAWWIQQGLSERAVKQTPYGSFSFSAKMGLSIGEVTWGILNSRDSKNATYYFRGAAVEDAASAEHLARPGDVYLSRALCDVLKEDVQLGDGASFRRLAGIRAALPDSAPVVLPPPDEAVSRVFVPESILLRDERGEFRQAVNLFMRFPDLPNESLQGFMHILFDLQEKYGGMLNRLDFGDKGCNMLMLWGAPVAYENDIGRALNFVLDLKARVDFPITAGVTYYIAHAGFLGGEMSECFTCYGWGVNLASRFMMSAPKGSIWIDERVARRVKNRFEFEYQGAQRFKGFDTEQKVYTLLGRKPQIESPHQGEFVGREAELARMMDFLTPLWDGNFAGVLGVWGEAGIGKSRLVYELSIAPSLQQKEILWGFCYSDQILRHSFNPFRYWLTRYFGITSEMDEAEKKRTFDARLDDLIENVTDLFLAVELDRTRSALGSLLDLEWPDSLYANLDAEGRYNNTVLALISLIKAESLRRPVALFIEDAQFLDEDSTVLLPRLKRALISETAKYPVAILVSSRRAGAEQMLGESLFDVSMDLGPLPASALADLAEIQLGGTVSPELVHLVQERSEGNPFFAEQILSFLQEEKLLEMSDNGWRVTRRLQESSLPADIRTLLMARLDQLSGHVREAVQTASVLGREFDTQILAAMMKNPSSLSEDLIAAEHAEILLPLEPGRYAFTHGLLRDSAYSMQMLTRRQELHAAAVDTFETIYSRESERHYGEIAYHAERAKLAEKAVQYLSLAGDQAMDLYQNSLAVDYFTRALTLIEDEASPVRIDLLLKRVEVSRRIGDRSRQAKDLESLTQFSERLENVELKAAVLIKWADYYFTTGDYSLSIEKAEKTLQSPGTNDHNKMDAHRFMMSSLLRLGRMEASVKHGQTGLMLARASGLKRDEARMLNGLGLISTEQINLPQAMEYLDQAVHLAREIPDRVIEISALNNMGNAAGLLGDYSMARDCYERSYLGVHERGDRYGEGLVLSNLGWVAGMQGDFAAARKYHQQALNIAREVGNPYQEAYTLINLSAVLGIQGDSKTALEYAWLSNEICQKVGERSGQAWALLNIGHAYLLDEDLEQARSAYEGCLAIREELRQPNLAAEALAGLAQIMLYRNDLPDLARLVESILAIMNNDKEFSGAEEPLRIYFTLYQAMEKMGDPRSKIVLGNAKQMLDAQVSKIKDEGARHMYVQNVPWRRALQEVEDPLNE